MNTVQHDFFGTGTITKGNYTKQTATVLFTDNTVRIIPIADLDIDPKFDDEIINLCKSTIEIQEWKKRFNTEPNVIVAGRRYDTEWLNTRSNLNSVAFCGFRMNLYNNPTNESKIEKWTGSIENKVYNPKTESSEFNKRKNRLSFVKRSLFRKGLNVPTNSNRFKMELPYYKDNTRNREHIGTINKNGTKCHPNCGPGFKKSIVGEPILNRYGRHEEIKVFKTDEYTTYVINETFWTEANNHCIEVEKNAITNNKQTPLFSRIFTQEIIHEPNGIIKRRPRVYEDKAFIILYPTIEGTGIEKLEFFNGRFKLDITNTIRPNNGGNWFINWETE